ELERVRNGQDLLSRLVLGSVVGLGLVVIASYMAPPIAVGRGVFILHAALAVPIVLLWRRFVFRTLRESALRPRALVLGEPAVVAGHSSPHAVVVAGRRAEALPVDTIVELRRHGLAVEDGAIAYEELTGKILIEKLTPGWLVFANAFERSKLEMRIRRVVTA